MFTQEKNFEEKRDEVYDYIESTIMRSPNPKIHLVFQSRGVMSKYYLNAYRLVNEFIYMNEGNKTCYMVRRITQRIIKANERIDPHCKFTMSDLFSYLVSKSDLHKFV